MAIYNCTACGYSKSAKDELIGQQAECPQCGEVNVFDVDVEDPAAALAVAIPSSRAVFKENIRADVGVRGFRMLFGATGMLVFFNCMGFLAIFGIATSNSRGRDAFEAGQILGNILFVVDATYAVLMLIGLSRLKGLVQTKTWKDDILWAMSFCIALPATMILSKLLVAGILAIVMIALSIILFIKLLMTYSAAAQAFRTHRSGASVSRGRRR